MNRAGKQEAVRSQSHRLGGGKAGPKRRAGRVILVVQEFPQASETFVASKFAGLLDRGWDAHVACLQSRRENWDLFPDLRDDRRFRRRVHVAWPLRPRWMAALLTPAACLRCLAAHPRAFARRLRGGIATENLNRIYVDAEIVCLRPDLVHFEFGALAAARVDIGRILGCPVVVSFRGYDLNVVGLGAPGYYDAVWRDAAALHFLGRDLREKALARGCPPEMPYALVPPAIDTRRFRPPAREGAARADSGRPLRVLSVGRLEWRKGYEDAATALGVLAARSIPVAWEIVGRGEHMEAIAFAAHQAGIGRQTRFLGHLPPEGVRDRMAQADVFLHPAVSEGFCNAVLEAQAMGLPVVCSDAGGLPENVEDGITGFVTPRRDPAAAAERLERLARDCDLRRRMGAAGVERVRQHFDPADQISRFEELYRATGCPGPPVLALKASGQAP